MFVFCDNCPSVRQLLINSARSYQCHTDFLMFGTGWLETKALITWHGVLEYKPFMSHMVSCEFAEVYNRFEVCTQVSLYLYCSIDAITERYWANAGHVLEDLDDEIPDLMSVSDSLDEGSKMPDLVLVSDSSEGSSNSKNDDSADEIGDLFEVPTEMVDEAIDCGIKPETHTYSTAMRASIALASPNHEIELYDSGVSHHMSPYHYNFINFIRIKG